MQTTLLSSQGRVTIPKALRAARCWIVGTRLEVLDTPQGVLLKPVGSNVKTELSSGLTAIRARIGHQRRAVSQREMDESVLRTARSTSTGQPR